MAELADALDLGSSGNTRAGSTPVIRTRKFLLQPLPKKFAKRLGIEDKKSMSRCSWTSSLSMANFNVTNSLLPDNQSRQVAWQLSVVHFLVEREE